MSAVTDKVPATPEKPAVKIYAPPEELPIPSLQTLLFSPVKECFRCGGCVGLRPEIPGHGVKLVVYQCRSCKMVFIRYR